MFYVYEWVRSDYNLAFYVGKGKDRRAYHFYRNNHTNNVVSYLKDNGHSILVRILANFETEEAAFEFEQERIAYLAPLGELTNKTIGGEGFCGGRHTEETKRKASLRFKGKKLSEEHRLKLIKPKSEEVRINMSKAAEAKKGKPLFDRETLRKNTLTLWSNPEYREKHIQERKIRDYTKLNLINKARLLGSKDSEETRKKKSDSAKIGWLKRKGLL